MLWCFVLFTLFLIDYLFCLLFSFINIIYNRLTKYHVTLTVFFISLLRKWEGTWEDGFPWFPPWFPMFSLCFPMFSLWFPYGFPMFSLCFPYVFPMLSLCFLLVWISPLFAQGCNTHTRTHTFIAQGCNTHTRTHTFYYASIYLVFSSRLWKCIFLSFLISMNRSSFININFYRGLRMLSTSLTRLLRDLLVPQFFFYNLLSIYPGNFRKIISPIY